MSMFSFETLFVKKYHKNFKFAHLDGIARNPDLLYRYIYLLQERFYQYSIIFILTLKRR